MTDFLHPQSTLPPDQLKDTSVSANSAVQPTIATAEQANVASVEPQMGAPLENDSSQEKELHPSEPIRRNFAMAGKNRPNSEEPSSENGEEVKRIVKKESSLLVHYYQSVFLVLITLFIASGYFMLNPLIVDFKQANQMIKFRLQEKDDATAFLGSVDRSIAAAKSISPETLSKINDALPKEAEIPILLKTFYQLADQNGVTMGGVQISPQKAGSDSKIVGGYALAPIQIAVSIQASGYHVMRKYLEDLQSNIQLMDVKSISVSGDGSTGEFSYTLELTTYIIQKMENSSPVSPVTPMGGVATPPSAPGISPNEI